METPGISRLFDGGAAASAALGGALLGATVAFKMTVCGGVLGISGVTRGLVMAPSAEKAAFILGLILAGLILRDAYGGVEPIPPASPSSLDRGLYCVRLAVGGSLVGFGTSMGNGCTSGHGLTGLARLSPRSWVGVPTFMATATLTATVLRTSRAVSPDPAAELAMPRWGVAAAWCTCAAALLLAAALATFVARARLGAKVVKQLRVAAELASGLAFGTGLVASGMAKPSKVAAFLDLGSGAWDPSLAFVMGGGVAVTFVFYQFLERRKFSEALLGGSFGLPPKTKPVDAELVAGCAIFGVGWGTCGLCPGPVWVSVGSAPSWQLLLAVAGMLLGMRAWLALQALRAAKSGKAGAEAGAGGAHTIVQAETIVDLEAQTEDTDQVVDDQPRPVAAATVLAPPRGSSEDAVRGSAPSAVVAPLVTTAAEAAAEAADAAGLASAFASALEQAAADNADQRQQVQCTDSAGAADAPSVAAHVGDDESCPTFSGAEPPFVSQVGLPPAPALGRAEGVEAKDSDSLRGVGEDDDSAGKNSGPHPKGKERGKAPHRGSRRSKVKNAPDKLAKK